MSQIWPLQESRKRDRRLLSLKVDAEEVLAILQDLDKQMTDILILTGISTAAELANEKGSMIHLFHSCKFVLQRCLEEDNLST